MDTVDLYFIRNRQRRLSLRFLAWYVLKENIQTDTHDSIEDALTALRLYNAFLEYEHEDLFDEKLEELYKEGKQYVSVLMYQHVRNSDMHSTWRISNHLHRQTKFTARGPPLVLGLEYSPPTRGC